MMLTAIESDVLKRFRCGERPVLNGRPQSPEDWIRYGLGVALDAGARIRAIRQAKLSDRIRFKADGTPYTRDEEDIENDLRRSLRELVPDAGFVGEEGGGDWKDRGLVVAMDPIDGTWAFMNHSETFTTSLAVFEDGESLLGIIFNPSTGEIAYSAGVQTARLVQLSMLGENDVGVDLPLEPPDVALLVNVHPGRMAGALMGRMFRAWNASDVRMVKAAGGSPSWALVEAAKGCFIYVNLWARRAADPFDLAPGVALVRDAGGDVVDLANRPIEISGHAGPFIAGIDRGHRERVVSLVSEMAAVSEEG
mgnify:FL=1